MTKDEALKIIEDEKLTNFNWFDDHALRANEVVIKRCQQGGAFIQWTREKA